MSLGINGRFLARAQPTGMQRAAGAIVTALLDALPPEQSATLLGEPAWLPPSPRLRLQPLPWSHWGRARAQLFEQWGLTRAARRAGLSVLLHPLQTSPLWPQGVRHVVTAHDLHFLHHPEWFGRAFHAWNRAVTLPALRRAHRVIAISDYVRQDLIATLGLDPARCLRIHTPFFGQPRPLAATPPPGPPRLLAINPFQPHKNLPRLIRVLQRLRAGPFSDAVLRVVGRPQENFAAVPALRDALAQPGVEVLGYLSDAELQAEWSQAHAFCLPSFSEGFGLPLLEAAAAGVPCLTSAVTAMPEIAGDGAITCDPTDDDSLYEGLRRLLSLSAHERLALLTRAQKNLARFHPSLCGQAYRDVLLGASGS